MTFRVFISSVQDEFAEERRRLKRWLTTDLFDFAGIIESLGTGIERMIKAGRIEHSGSKKTGGYYALCR